MKARIAQQLLDKVSSVNLKKISQNLGADTRSWMDGQTLHLF
jgi:hypothetical protein